MNFLIQLIATIVVELLKDFLSKPEVLDVVEAPAAVDIGDSSINVDELHKILDRPSVFKSNS